MFVVLRSNKNLLMATLVSKEDGDKCRKADFVSALAILTTTSPLARETHYSVGVCSCAVAPVRHIAVRKACCH
jgi:hypothetical protein